MMTSTQWNAEKRWALALLWLLQLGDFLSTMATRRVAGVVELNPFGAGADGHADIMKTAACKLVGLVICVFLVRRASKMAPIWIMVGLYVTVVVSNSLLAFQ